MVNIIFGALRAGDFSVGIPTSAHRRLRSPARRVKNRTVESRAPSISTRNKFRNWSTLSSCQRLPRHWRMENIRESREGGFSQAWYAERAIEQWTCCIFWNCVAWRGVGGNPDCLYDTTLWNSEAARDLRLPRLPVHLEHHYIIAIQQRVKLLKHRHAAHANLNSCFLPDLTTSTRSESHMNLVPLCGPSTQFPAGSHHCDAFFFKHSLGRLSRLPTVTDRCRPLPNHPTTDSSTSANTCSITVAIVFKDCLLLWIVPIRHCHNQRA